jgi:hypothetical protein
MLPKVQELNSFAKIAAEPTTIEDLTDEYFEAFSVILLTECTEAQAVRINNICRQRNPNCSFFWSDMFGEEGIFYSDFGAEFAYKEDKQPSSSNATAVSASSGSSTDAPGKDAGQVKTMNFPALETVVKKRWCESVSRHFPLSKTFVRHRLIVQFRYLCPFIAFAGNAADGCFDGVARRELHGREPSSGDAAALQLLLSDAQQHNGLPAEPPVLDESQLQRLCQVAGTASVLACSVLGSYLSQEVVKAVSHTGEPAFNVFVFSGEDLEAKAFPVR